MFFRHLAILLLTLPLICSGCFTSERAHLRSTGQDHLHVANYGWYLFHFLPIVCGDDDTRAAIPWSFFSDKVTMDCIQQRFMELSDEEHFSVSGLNFTTSESVLMNIPGSSQQIPIPYLITMREIQLSGVLTPKADTAEGRSR